MNYHKPDLSASKTVAIESLKYQKRRQPHWSVSYRAIAPIAMFVDAFTIVLMGVLGNVAYQYLYSYDGIGGRSGDIVQAAGLAAVVAALFVSFGKIRNLYDPAELLNLKSQIQRVSFKWLAVLLFLAAAAFAMKAGGNFSRGSTILFAGFGLAALIGERVLWRVVLADGLSVRRF